MYLESELLGKEVISSEGSIAGEVIEITVNDDIPNIVVGETGFLVGKDRAIRSGGTLSIPVQYMTKFCFQRPCVRYPRGISVGYEI